MPKINDLKNTALKQEKRNKIMVLISCRACFNYKHPGWKSRAFMKHILTLGHSDCGLQTQTRLDQQTDG